MKRKKRGTVLIMMSLLLTVTTVILCADGAEKSYQVKGVTWKYGIGEALGFNESTYKTIPQITGSANSGNNNWRDGSVTANGEIGFIESCDPNEDVFIFNNTKIVSDTTDFYETPVISNVLEQQRKGAVIRKDESDDTFPWIRAANQYGTEQYGSTWGLTWCRPYQPAAQYRIKNNAYTSENGSAPNYNRYTNYETGEVGVQWKDNEGNEWNRRSFASRSDDIIVTFIEAPDNKDLNITMSIDHILQMRNENSMGASNAIPTTDYIVEEDEKGYTMGLVGKYLIRSRKGNKNREETLFARGGWGTATRIITDGDIDYQADTRNITYMNSFSGSAIMGAKDPKVTITNTKSVMLVTKVDRQDSGCNTTQDIKDQLYNRLIGEIDSIIGAKSITSDAASYNKLLEPHVKIHGGMFDNVRVDLCATEEEKADRQLTNTELIARQNSSKKVLNKAFMERVYNNGRFGLICASGYGTSRLGAIWTGTWNPPWSGDFTLDANTNLQVSGMNTGNMEGASQGYVNFILRMVADWEADATNIYGMTDAIKAPPRVDGTGQAGSYHFLEGYPHIYVNGITDWVILPMFEYWQCYGNRKIKVGKDIDIDRNQNVLNLSDADVARIKASGEMDLEKDILYPMLIKTMNFWLQYVDDNFYTDGKGEMHLNDGTTLSEAIKNGDTNAKYIFTPGYSPENSPKGYGDNSRSALAYNTTMDISASRNTLFMARTMLDLIKPSDAKEKLAKWADFESKIPDYQYADTGELKEWATTFLQDKHSHRHASQAYPAWPGYETQDSRALREGLIKAMDYRSAAYNGAEAPESHGPTHKSLIEARLKNVEALDSVLLYLLTSNYQYSSMMTSHNNNRSSCYCTDSAFGIMGAVNESLLYSNTGKIEILPTLLSNLNKGSINGLRARCNTLVDRIEWDKDNMTASVTLTSDEDNNKIQLNCGIPWSSATVNGTKQAAKADTQRVPYIDLTLSKGASVTVEFTLTESISISTATDLSKRLSVGTTVEFNAEFSTKWIEEEGVQWKVVNAANDESISGVTISENGRLTVGEETRGKFLKVYMVSTNGSNIKSNELFVNISNVTPGSGNTEELFGTYAAIEYSDLMVYISNDKKVKNVSVIWAAYDEGGRLVDTVQQECSLGANEYKQLILPASWNVDAYETTMFIWDRDSFEPYTEKMQLKTE